MRYLISFFFFSPFYIQFVLAAFLGYVGYNERQEAAAETEQARAMLAAAPPATVPIDEFTALSPKGNVQEFSVSAQFASDHNTRLVKTKNGVTVDESLMIVLIDPDAPADDRVARAAIIFEPDQKDAMIDWLVSHMTTMGPAGPVVTISGLVTGAAEAAHAKDALHDDGMKLASDFFFMSPFLKGRDAGYQARIAAIGRHGGSSFFWLAGFLALVGVAKLIRGQMKRKAGATSTGRGAMGASPGSGRDPDMASLVAAERSAFVDWASKPSQQPSGAALRSDQSAAARGLAMGSSRDRITRQKRKSPRFGFAGTVALLVVVGFFATRFGGLGQTLPDALTHPEQLLASLKAALPTGSIKDQALPGAAPQDGTATAKVQAEPASVESASVESASAEGPAVTSEPQVSSPAWQEPPTATLALILAIVTIIFIVVQRRKANRF